MKNEHPPMLVIEYSPNYGRNWHPWVFFPASTDGPPKETLKRLQMLYAGSTWEFRMRPTDERDIDDLKKLRRAQKR